jgi:3-methylcrotonyl-CoA carboxylase beta subunit
MRLASRVRTGDPEFQENRAHMERLVAELRGARARAAEGGSAEARERHTARGKLLPRERIERLLDPGTPFLELRPVRRS